eukprot:SAG31_NODE_4854_length_2904_cov_1.684492_3_plen_249_part_00
MRGRCAPTTSTSWAASSTTRASVRGAPQDRHRCVVPNCNLGLQTPYSFQYFCCPCFHFGLQVGTPTTPYNLQYFSCPRSQLGPPNSLNFQYFLCPRFQLGMAQVLGSGCGVGAGGPEREMDGGTAREFGLVQNMDGKHLPPLSHGSPARWKRGSAVEVAWANNANHGGGYSYRLCKADGNVTEACFQAGHLDFVGNISWLQVQSPQTASGLSHDPDHPTTGLCGTTPGFAVRAVTFSLLCNYSRNTGL